MAGSVAYLMLLSLAAMASAEKATMVSAEKALASPNPIRKVVELMEEMRDQLTKTQEEEQKMYDKMNCWCITNKAAKEKAIADGKTLAERLQAEIEALSARAGELVALVAKTKKQIEKDKETLKAQEKIREEQRAQFTGEEKDLIQLLTNLKSAIMILGRHYALLQADTDSPILASVRSVIQDASMKYDLMMAEKQQNALYAKPRAAVSFLQTDHYESMSKQLKSALGMNSEDEEALPVEFAARTLAKAAAGGGNPAFVQGSASSGQPGPVYSSYGARSGVIFGMLKQMEEDFTAELTAAQGGEASAKAAYDLLVKTKMEELKLAKEQLDNMQMEYATTLKSISTSEDDLEGSTEQRVADVEMLGNMGVECENINRDWEKRTNGRNAEIAAMTQAIGILFADDARDQFDKAYDFMQVKSISEASAEARMRRARAAETLRNAALSPSLETDDLINSWNNRNSKMSLLQPRTQLATLAVSVQIDSFTKVKEAMNTMIADLKAQQSTEVEFKANCTRDLDQTEKDTYVAGEKKKDLEALIKSLEATIKKIIDENAVAAKKRSDTMDAIKEAGETRQKESEEYQTDVTDQQNIQAILTRALTRLEATYGKRDKAATLLQRSARSKREEPLGAAGITDGAAPPERFQEYKQHAGASPLLSLIQSIIDDSVVEEKELVVEEQEKIKAYETFLFDSRMLVKALDKEIKEKNVQKDQAYLDKNQADSDLGFTNGELESLANFDADLHAKCDFTLKNFDIRQKARLEEIEAVQNAKAFLSGMLK